VSKLLVQVAVVNEVVVQVVELLIHNSVVIFWFILGSSFRFFHFGFFLLTSTVKSVLMASIFLDWRETILQLQPGHHGLDQVVEAVTVLHTLSMLFKRIRVLEIKPLLFV